MNERIQELARQAGYQEDMFGIGHWDMLECQRFAELIVRECAAVCDSYGMPDGTSQTAMILSRAIKNKFGIE
jgi:hypothetical protein